MSDKISSIAVVLSSVEALRNRWRSLALPVLLLAVAKALEFYFSGIHFVLDPFGWLIYNLPIQILSAPLIILTLHVLISSDAETSRYPASYVMKTVLFLWYSLLYFLGSFLFVAFGFTGISWAFLFTAGAWLSGEEGPWVKYVAVAVVIPVLVYVSARVSMVYPLVADGVKGAVRQSWKLTRSRFFPMVISIMALLLVPVLVIVGVEMVVEAFVSGSEYGLLRRAWDVVAAVGTELLMISLLATWYVTLNGLRQEATEPALPADTIPPADEPAA